MRIKIDHIAKIEGHASFTADIINGDIRKARIKIDEGARLFESIIVGRRYDEIPAITSRICGVCPVVHNLTAYCAIESAFSVEPEEAAKNVRKLMMLGQVISSHALHIFFFSLSDFFGIKSDLELFKKYPKKTEDILKIKSAGDRIVEILGGRTIHPLSAQVGGLRKVPKLDDFIKIGLVCAEALPLAEDMARFFSDLHYPSFSRKMNFVSLTDDSEYAIYNGRIKTLEGDEMASTEFMPHVKETQMEGDVHKRSSFSGKSYMTGALARINNNYSMLNESAASLLNHSEIRPMNLPSFNTFYNILAQAIEIVHCLEEALKLAALDTVLVGTEKEITPEKAEGFVQEGRGIYAMEAPRGTLFYDLEFDGKGLLKKANIITPTSQNLANMEEDLKRLIPNTPKDKQKDKIKMLIRAYDPCITCATH